MKRFLLVLALATLAPLAACGQAQSGGALTWSMYQNGTTHNAVLPLDFPAVSWTRNLHAKINGGLAYDGRYLYVDDFDNDLLALDPQTGTIAWRARADDVLMSTPIVAEGMVFVGSGTNAVLSDAPSGTVWGRKEGNHLFAFRTGDGKEVWSYPTVGEAMPSPAYLAGQLMFATGDNLATAVVAASPKPIWKTPLPGVPTMMSTMVHDGFAFFVATQGKAQYASPTRSHTLALGTTDGKVRWSAPFGNADCTPTVAQGMVFVEGANDGPLGPREAWGSNDVSALDEQTGTIRWHYRSPNGQFTNIGSLERAITGTYDGGVLYQSVPISNSMIAFPRERREHSLANAHGWPGKDEPDRSSRQGVLRRRRGNALRARRQDRRDPHRITVRETVLNLAAGHRRRHALHRQPRHRQSDPARQTLTTRLRRW